LGCRSERWAYLLANSEQDAIEIVADAFAQDAAQLKAAPDKTKALPFMGIIPGEIRKDDQFRS
jgi:hypothetical protein